MLAFCPESFVDRNIGKYTGAALTILAGKIDDR